MKLSILIGGSAGQGVNTTEKLLLECLSNSGYFHHTYKEYMSRVRGGLNFSQLTISEKPVQVYSQNVDLLVAFTQETIDSALSKLNPTGVLLCDEKFTADLKPTQQRISLNYSSLLKDTQNPKGLSMLILGALVKMLSLPKSYLENLQNTKWSETALTLNQKTALTTYDIVDALFSLPISDNKNTMTLSGNHSIALGAAAAGVSFYCAYPMAPSTSVMNYLSRYEKNLEILIEQAEDEIAAISAVIGASAVGARAMTASSGGGFSLMVESLGFAAVSEIPLVVLDVQRPGPATGMATRTEQSDLNFVLNASQGEFPRFVLSFKNVEDCFYQTFKAFNLADQYRVPVLLLSDQYLADSTATIDAIDLSTLEIDRNLANTTIENYKHYDFDDLFAPRLCPGMGEQIIMNDSHEHDEYGHVTESGKNRIMMNHRRMEKLIYMKEAVSEPEYFGSQTPDYALISWGSVTESVKEAVRTLLNEGHQVACLSFNDLYPLPTEELEKLIAKEVPLINVEGNYQGQLAQLIAREMGHITDSSILKFDGRQLSPEYIVSAYKELTDYE